MQPEITVDDLNRIYVLIDPDDGGSERINVTVARMTDRQFRTWMKAKTELHGLKMNMPIGRVGHQTRAYMLNRLVQAGVRIYMTPKGIPLL